MTTPYQDLFDLQLRHFSRTNELSDDVEVDGFYTNIGEDGRRDEESDSYDEDTNGDESVDEYKFYF